MKVWQRIKNILTTPIPGPIVAGCLTGVTLGTILGLFISLPVRSPKENILEESTFGKNESLSLVLKTKGGDELHLKVTGVTTMDLVQSLKKMLKDTEGNLLLEKSFLFM